MIGEPKFNYKDQVYFHIEGEDNKPKKLYGEIYIIDAYGTFFDDSDVSYDVYVPDQDIIYKHIPEKWLFKVED